MEQVAGAPEKEHIPTESTIPPLSYEQTFHTIFTPLTSKYGFGVNRVMVYIRNRTPGYLDGTYGVGPLNGEEVQDAWKNPPTLKESVFERPPSSHRLNEAIKNTQITINEHRTLDSAVKAQESRISKGNDSLNHFFISHGIDLPGQYAIVPVLTQGPIEYKPEVLGVLFGDNTYTPEVLIDECVKELEFAAIELSAAVRTAQIYKQMQDILSLLHKENGRKQLEKDNLIYELCEQLAHLIRNPVTSVGGNARTLERLIKENAPIEKISEHLGAIVDGADRLEQLSNTLPDEIRALLQNK